MTEIVPGLLGAAFQIIKWVAAPIMSQFNYLCCFTTNVDALKREAKKLDDAASGLQGQVDRAADNLEVVVPEVETWLTNSKQFKDQTTTILDQVPNVQSRCLKLRARFRLSKRAKKTIDQIKELRGECKFDAISQAGPPTAREAIPLGKTYEFRSRKQIEEDMMTALKGGDVKMIGICGMGGLGKTTMAKRIMNRVLEEHAFEEVVMAVVNQQVDKSKIQYEIAGSLGLKFELETSEAARVKKLHARLSGSKRILLVLDDVWQRLVLEDLGIPCDSKGCTILLTSRNRDVLHAMNVQKIFGMKVLSEEEAWFLFKEQAGTYVNDTKLNSIAKNVMKECRGLPIALTIVGAALKDENDACIWQDALRQLKQSDPDIPDFIAEVYNPLKLSYDFLEAKHAKSLILLCCLFPEDVNIHLEMLTYFCTGLGIFEGIRNFEEARNRMRALIKMLKCRSLLLDGWNDDYVRMHDVVRDVCIFIAKHEKFIGGNDWISTCQRLTGLRFPNSRLLLLIRSYNSAEEEFKLDNAFLQGSRDLSVLCIQGYNSLTSMPPATQPLTNLKTLFLHSCNKLNSISFVGEIVNLEILICFECTSIEELPQEMKGLNRLKILELTGCHNLQRIGRGIISSLVGLEELKMGDSFRKWEAEDSEERENAGLKELEALTNLRWLEIEIEDPALAAENMCLSSKIDRFIILLGAQNYFLREAKKVLYLKLEVEICLGHWIEKQLLSDTECLYLCRNSANNVRLPECQNLRWLRLSKCETVKNLGQLSILPQLETLQIFHCEMMEQVFLWNEEDVNENNSKSRNRHMITKLFPKLKILQLVSLPSLTTFYQGIEGIEFPLLETLMIEECPKMKFITRNGNSRDTSSSATIDDDHAHLFCQPQKVSFTNDLKELRVEWNPFCGHKIPLSLFNGLEKLTFTRLYGSMSLLSSSTAENLFNLRVLTMINCDEMLKVVEAEKKVVSGGKRDLLFPKLEELYLVDLPKLVSFCGLKRDVLLPSLRKVEIYECPNMVSFTMGFIAAPNLGYVTIDYKNIGDTKDLNGLLQEAYLAQAKVIKKIQEEEEKEKGSKSDTSEFI